mmetsp:Transcript_61758/g.162222  ORF Transcript_61758/g.162222 Transcript_61758/m.162222 type:complete len:515 (+) Transcript_61758:95-1639(+)
MADLPGMADLPPKAEDTGEPAAVRRRRAASPGASPCATAKERELALKADATPLTPHVARAKGGAPFGLLARSVQCYLLLGARLFQQANRNALAPLLVFMAQDFEISTAQKGTLLSAIAAGYFFTQVPGGALADRLGAKTVVTMAIGLSSICCMLIPMCTDMFGVPGLWVVMAAMGAVQGPLFPTSTVFLSRWMPKKTAGSADEKAWGTSMLDIGISVGSLLIIPVANTLAGNLGWRRAYQIIGLASLGFTALWHQLAAEEPSRCSFISAEELSFLEENVPKKPAAKPAGAGTTAAAAAESTGILGIPLRLALHPGLWAIFVAHICFNYGAYYLTNWSPTYYAEVLRVDPAEAKYHLMLPHIANLATKSLVPTMVTAIDQRGYTLLASRRIFTVAGFLAAGAALAPIHQLKDFNPWVSTILFSVANACFGLAPAGFKSNYLDVTERYVGVVSGYGNTLGTVASWIGPQFVAFILARFASWDIVLCSVAGCNVLAALFYMRYATVTPIEATKAKAT